MLWWPHASFPPSPPLPPLLPPPSPLPPYPPPSPPPSTPPPPSPSLPPPSMPPPSPSLPPPSMPPPQPLSPPLPPALPVISSPVSWLPWLALMLACFFTWLAGYTQLRRIFAPASPVSPQPPPPPLPPPRPTHTLIALEPSGPIGSFIHSHECCKCYANTQNWTRTTLRILYTREQGQWYKRLNSELRSLTATDQVSADIRLPTLLLANAIYLECVDTLPGRAYRGIQVESESLHALAEAYASVQQGQHVYFHGFTSASRSRQVAENFAGDSGILFDIELVRGRRKCVADMRNSTAFPDEEEILISCNAGFSVLGVDMNTSPLTVTLRLEDETRCPRRLNTPVPACGLPRHGDM